MFSNLYFYDGSVRFRRHFAGRTEALGNMTIGELRRQCYRDGKHVEHVLGATYGVHSPYEFFESGDVVNTLICSNAESTWR